MGHAGLVRQRGPGAPRAWLRGLSGLLAGGLVVLAAVLVVVWVVADRLGQPGPGAGLLAWHGAGAAAAVLAQRVADRRSGTAATLAALAVVTITVVVLAVQWLG